MNTSKEFPKSTAIILRVIRKHGKLSADDFDRIFSNTKIEVVDGVTYHSPRKFKFRDFDCGKYFIGDMVGGQWSAWLHLTQLLALEGLVKIVAENNEVWYELVL